MKKTRDQQARTAEPRHTGAPGSGAGESRRAGTPARRGYLVRLDCPTPLAQHEMVVEAASAEEAWDAFCRANGLSGSDHARRVVPIGSGEPTPAKHLAERVDQVTRSERTLVK